jgi:hypothetical protein
MQNVTVDGTAESPERFSYTIRSVRGSFEYRWQCGDGRTPWLSIRAEDRPLVAQARVRITPPTYSKLPVDTFTTLPQQVRALRGSRLEMDFLATKPLSQMQVLLGRDRAETLVADQNSRYRYETVLQESMLISPSLVDRHGLASPALPSCRVVVYADQPPSVEIVSPRDELAVRPGDAIEIRFEARDDFGVDSAELLLTKEGGEAPAANVIPFPLGKDQGARSVRGTFRLDLAALKLTSGSELTYAVRVRDARQAAATTNVAPSATPPGSEQAQRPSNDMTRRALDVGQDATCSRSQRLRIDDWAGAFEGEARQKLQIELEGCMERLVGALREAGDLTDALVGHTRSGSPWDKPAADKAAQADRRLSDAHAVVSDLQQRSADTPYAFVGLQLADIDLSHVRPASENLARAGRLADKPAEQLKQLELASYHIARARELLQSLIHQYESIRTDERRAEGIRRLAKMHQVFVEDMQVLLEACRPVLNPREGKWQIIPDDVAEQILKAVKDRLERRKQLMNALAKVLANDPDLMRRFMANARKSARTLRDQLTVLARRQSALRDRTAAWIDKDDAGRKELLSQAERSLAAEAGELVASAAQLYDNTVMWAPRGLDATRGPLAQCRDLAGEITTQMRQVPSALAAGNVGQAVAVSNHVRTRLAFLQETLATAGSPDARDSTLTAYLAKRLTEARDLASRQADWVDSIKVVREAGYAQAAAIDQGRLGADTDEFGSKMERAAAGLGLSFSSQIGDKASELAGLLRKDIVTQQDAATLALEREEWSAARDAQNATVTSFTKAEKLFDDLLASVEEAAASRPVKPPTSAPGVSSLENQLAALVASLDQECEACEKLGAVIHSNVMLQLDWMKPGGGEGGGGGGGGSGGRNCSGGRRGAGCGSPDAPRSPELASAIAQARARQAEAREALARVREMQKSRPGSERPTTRAASRPADPARPDRRDRRAMAPRTPEQIRERDWNVLVSRLQDELRQGRGNSPPEEYRQAIDEYFREISDTLSQSPPAGE